ncbi:MAG: MBL fold metallo-hydrolase [Anaerolineales bacterium]
MRIHQVSLRFSESYLIEVEQGLILVDAGLPGSENQILKEIKQLQFSDLKIIFITHAHLDHYGSAAAIRNLTGAKIAIHSADAAVMSKGETHLGIPKGRGKIVSPLMPLLEKIYPPARVRADILLDDGDRLQIGGIVCKVVHTPGHTSGSCTYLFNERFAFVGDLLSNNGGPHVQKYFAQDWSLISSSVQTLKSYNPQWAYAGHGKKPINQADLQKL